MDGPNYEGLAPSAIASSKDTLNRSSIVAVDSVNIVPLVQVKAEFLADVVLRGNEAHGEDDEVSGPLSLGSLDGTRPLGGDFNVLGDEALDIAIVVADELLGHDGVDAGVLSEEC